MKSEIIFFDSTQQSYEGTKRGLIAFISLILFDLIWFSISKKVYPIKRLKYVYLMVIPYLLLCSAIAVQQPKSYKEALLWSFLVGLVVYGIYNSTNMIIIPQWSIKIGIIDTIAGIINCCIAGTILYFIYWNPK
jgi:uncharacterized membrane protein